MGACFVVTKINHCNGSKFQEHQPSRFSLEKYSVDPTTPDLRLSQNILALKLVADKNEAPFREYKGEAGVNYDNHIVSGEGRVNKESEEASEAVRLECSNNSSFEDLMEMY